jgi:hypothetical protein
VKLNVDDLNKYLRMNLRQIKEEKGERWEYRYGELKLLKENKEELIKILGIRLDKDIVSVSLDSEGRANMVMINKELEGKEGEKSIEKLMMLCILDLKSRKLRIIETKVEINKEEKGGRAVSSIELVKQEEREI